MKKNDIKRTLQTYTIGTSIVIVLIVALEFGIGYLVTGNEGMAKVINLAGRQRMLSQKIAKQTFHPQLTLHKSQLTRDAQNWKAMHYFLQNGNDSLQIPRLRFKHIAQLFTNLNAYVENINEGVAQYRAGKIDQARLQSIVANNEKAFLSGMDAVVYSLEAKVEGRVSTIHLFGIISSLIVVVVLLLTFFRFMKPFSKSLLHYIDDLNENEEIIQAQNHELQQTLEQAHQQNEELQTIEEELRTALESQGELNSQLDDQLKITSQQAEQMQDAQKMANLGYWNYEVTSGLLEWSDTMYALFDISPNGSTKALSMNQYLKNIHPEDRLRVTHFIEKIKKEKQIHDQHRIVHQDGEVRTVNAVLKAQYDPQTQVMTAVLGVVQDVTEQLQQEQELQIFNESLQKVVNFSSNTNQNFEESIQHILEYTTNMLGMQVGIISNIVNQKYTVDFWYSNNPEIQLEKGQEFVFNNTYCELTYRNNQLLAIQHMASSPYSGHPCYQAFSLESYIGIPIWMNGEKSGTINFSSPLQKTTSFKNYEKDYIEILSRIFSYVLERSSHIAKLENFNQSQKNILHVMAHDLRTPLNNLYGVISLLKESELSEEKSAKLFELAEKEHKQGISLMEDMLASFSLENTEEAQKELVNVSEFLEEFAQKTLPKTQQNQLLFNSSILPNITANIYPFRFQRVVENLISNAIKFTPTKGQINLMLHKEEHMFVVVVADSGIGIPKSMQPHLFKKFNKQIKRQGLKGEKTNGLGLSIVKQIVEQHEGQIYINSEEGKGTAITLKIPL